MKKYLVVIVVIVLLLCCACSPLRIEGLDNFRLETCSVGLTKNLFPSEDFLSRFPYESGNYHYFEDGDIAWGHVTVIAYLQYEIDAYSQAKDFCLDNFNQCINHNFEYANYCFVEHFDNSGNACNYPKQFSMLAYNDEQQTLVFLGYYNGDPNSYEKDLAIDNFGEFVEDVFSSYFNFKGQSLYK